MDEFSGGIFKNGKRCVLKQMREEKLFQVLRGIIRGGLKGAGTKPKNPQRSPK